ncbi:phosphomannomutase/phosphoglucomutase [Lysobacter sp. KIS68-7]|uniref:phosphomannomutase/phosphoglucomutase n=1 Tax=Lysobacter sp. KIS68-7 TaxID=2904252 RepID=UPI001E5E0759|nr:phosphomannomutase/phosphoglucomutase [Lysobacter sp. KIS68-7]UHQ20584.1 phosphomannomutase/phosphoglucomutase [Lysobacter sp. KIS68-7]
MSDKSDNQDATAAPPPKLAFKAQLRPALPAIALVCALIAAWMAWSGFQQFRADTRRAELVHARDAMVGQVSEAVKKHLAKLAAAVASAPVQSALAANDFAGAAAALKATYPEAQAAEVLGDGFEGAYAGLPATGFGKVGLMESALTQKEPIAAIVRDGGSAHLGLATLAAHGGTTPGVAYVRLPLTTVTGPVEGRKVDDASYIALRQGAFSVVERGDTALAGGAEVLASPVPGSPWRIAAGLPDTAKAPFELGAIPCFGTAAILALLAFLAFRSSRNPVVAEAHDEDAAQAPTLAEAMEQNPTARAPVAAPVVVREEVPHPVGKVLIDKGIFRAYDIRGVVGKTLDVGIAELIGQSVGSLMADKGLMDIVVGRDGRLSGPDMVSGLVAGLRKAGRNVIDIGMAATPVVYFAAYQLRTGCAIAVTGSHNPPDYNGFKIVVGGETLAGKAIDDLYARIAEGRLQEAHMLGNLQHRDVAQDYIDRITSDVQLDRRLKVVIDAGNGVAGAIAPQVLAAIGAEVTPLFCEVDGTFPNHHPDPSEPHNLESLIQMVKRLDADLGVAFDGDGDRLGVVTKEGKNIFPDRLLMLFAADVLERNPGAVIVYDVKCTGRLPGQILRHGGSPLMWKTGHSLIKAKMRETDAELAGEMSGHFFFKERWYGFDDGIYAAARLLEILASRSQTPSETLDALPEGVSTPEIKVDAPDGDPHAFVDRFRAVAKFEGARLSTIDGLRVDWPDGWGLVRASNTTPVLVLRFDGDSKEALIRIQDAFRTQLLALRPDLNLPF